MDDASPSDGNIGLDVVDDPLNSDSVKGNIVWAGLEPIEFTALFPDWIERKDVGQINIQVMKRQNCDLLPRIIFIISKLLGWSK